MKHILTSSLIFFSLLICSCLWAADRTLVCIPDLNTSTRSLIFSIKPSAGNCPKDEKAYEVQKSEGGIVLFLPQENANSPATQPNAIPGNPSPGKPFSYY